MGQATAVKLVVVALVASMLLLPACVFPNPVGGPTCYPEPLQVNPVSVPAGSDVAVSSGPFQCQNSYPSGKTYGLALNEPSGPGKLSDLGSYPVSADGSFNALVRIPNSYPAGPAYIIVSGSTFDQCRDSEGSCAAYVASLTILTPGAQVRDGATSALIQQFGGLNDKPPLGLKASVHVSDAVVISKLVHELNFLPAFPGGIHCPMDDGSYFVLVFTYTDGTDTTVKVEASGCGEVYVGGSTEPAAWTATSPALFDTLRGLLAHKPAS